MALDRLAHGIAAELRDLAAATEGLAAALCADPDIAGRCLGLLQQFDLIAQSQCELADLLLRLNAGTERDEALQAMRLAGMAERLAQAA
ncbi:hypothetical protein [Sphingomonas sp. LHG3443-2]|uniref:hypothetical protein n=1 Tax=Sphingomonas sp. LHG3443-2 TaxID=2804639 RepID=UPI003CE6C8A4